MLNLWRVVCGCTKSQDLVCGKVNRVVRGGGGTRKTAASLVAEGDKQCHAQATSRHSASHLAEIVLSLAFAFVADNCLVSLS